MKADLTDILNQIKEKEYPQLKMAHYYPVINEMDFLDDYKKRKLDDLLKYFYCMFLYTESSAWYSLRLNKEIETKVLEFLLDKKIIEPSYIIKCGCHLSDCEGKRISQERYEEFVNWHKNNKYGWEEDDCKGYIEIPCWNGREKEIYDMDTFMKEIRLFAYKNVCKPDLSLDNI